MWKAEKIELKTLGETKHPKEACNVEWMVLFINGVSISNSIIDINMYDHFDYFQDWVCDYCGIEGCNPGGYLITITIVNNQ